MAKKTKKAPVEKFQFTIDYQSDLIKLILTNQNGYKALDLCKADYFTNIEHEVLVQALQTYYKKYHKIPGKSMLKETMLDMISTRNMADVVTKEIKNDILDAIDLVFKDPLKDSDAIMEKLNMFVSHIEFKSVMEDIDIYDLSSYEQYLTNISKAVRMSTGEKDKVGTFLIKDVANRQFHRQVSNPIVKTPIRQINALTNAGGYSRNSIIVLLDKPKNLKTTALINIARMYMAMKKNVFIADFENGEEELAIRAEQQISRKDKKQILSGEYDKQIQKVLRKYKRVGGEIYIRRFNAYDTAAHIEREMEMVRQDYGIEFQELICDYPGIMGSLSNKKEDTDRISDVYLDLANLAVKQNLEHIWCAHHVVRTASVRETTRYKENDIAKCIDIVRHVQAIYGLNRTPNEMEEGIFRMELISQRDGVPFGRALFHADIGKQYIQEFSKAEVEKYAIDYENMGEEEGAQPKRRTKTDI